MILTPPSPGSNDGSPNPPPSNSYGARHTVHAAKLRGGFKTCDFSKTFEIASLRTAYIMANALVPTDAQRRRGAGGELVYGGGGYDDSAPYM